MRENLKERWALGEELSPADHAVAMVYGDIINLTWEDVEETYGTDGE